jgi:branched-chain amino acid transport system ATP-binding protein
LKTDRGINMPFLEGKKVTKYFGGLAAVDNVDFHVEQGEIIGIIGPNGAGKTTLFNLISKAIPVTSGMLRFKGQDITKMKAHNICQLGISRTFQDGKLFPKMTVLENVQLGAMFGSAHIATFQAKEKAMELLEIVRLAGKERLLAQDLTLAAQKRLEVARALATKPELLMLDEVMAGLTPTEVGESLELIKSMHSSGITILLIEHVMKAIMSISQRIIVLHHGKKIAEGTPQAVCNDEAVIKIYLGVTSAEG